MKNTLKLHKNYNQVQQEEKLTHLILEKIITKMLYLETNKV